jgi:hypothetical protein
MEMLFIKWSTPEHVAALRYRVGVGCYEDKDRLAKRVKLIQ